MNRSSVPAISNISSSELLAALSSKGYIILELPEDLQRLTLLVFDLFRRFDTRPLQEKALFELTANSGCENNGWHAVGALSKYNRCRDGYIFQGRTAIPPLLSEKGAIESDEFSSVHEEWRAAVCRFAGQILQSLGTSLDLPDPATYFTKDGVGLDVISESQFHIKKTTLEGVDKISIPLTDNGYYITMPTHCDPSVISIVIHAEEGLSGLQVRDANKKLFVDIPPTGPYMCTLFSGNLLEYLSNRRIKSCVHRVISAEADLEEGKRIAASFFFQPTLDSMLIPFDSSCSSSAVLSDARSTDALPSPITYEKWKNRVYGNYYKGKRAEKR